MATNPAFGVLSPRFAGTFRVDSQNVEEVNKSKKRNKFDYSNTVYDTFRFGEVRPFFHMRSLPNDTVTLISRHELWTHVLQSPLMSDLTMYKDYFYIPYKAIMPNTWDAFISTPVQGDDCPSDTYLYFDFGKFIAMQMLTLYNTVSVSSGSIDPRNFGAALGKLFSVYVLLSQSSLPCALGININARAFVYYRYNGIDYCFDKEFEDRLMPYIKDLFSDIDTLVITVPSPYGDSYGGSYKIISGSAIDTSVFMSFLYDFMTVTPYGYGITLNVNGTVVPSTSNSTYFSLLKAFVFALFDAVTQGDTPRSGSATPLLSGFVDRFAFSFIGDSVTAASSWCVDITPLVAYQLVGAQFYVNDNVDSVFTAKDWYSNLRSLIFSASGVSSTTQTFDYNGTDVYYDLLSYHYTSSILSASDSDSVHFNDTDSAALHTIIQHLCMPFESLRYGDYFTGSRLSPLAVGADQKAVAPVVSNEVSAVDLTKSIAWQSFLNDVMKLGPVQWIQQNGIFGEMPSTLDPMPRFISRERVSIGEQQIENTSDNQGEIVSRMRSSSGDFAFEISTSEHSIVLGLISFDIPRNYTNVIDRFAFTYDREDFFNPYFQNIGDQGIYLDEIGGLNASAGSGVTPETDFTVFGWQLRDTQYKQRVNVALGAFKGSYYLPSWLFSDNLPFVEHLNSHFIRNHNSEFDRFYVSLPNYGAGYFHFYARIRNNCEAVRAMQYRPGIQLPLIHQ